MTDDQLLHHSFFILQKQIMFYFHMRHALAFGINKTGNKNRRMEKFENTYQYKMCFRIYYNMKFTLPYS